MSDTPATRVCPECSVEKPLTADFWYKAKNAKHGFCPYCKSCDAARHRAYYQENKEKVRAQQAEYLAVPENLDKKRAYFRERRKRIQFVRAIVLAVRLIAHANMCIPIPAKKAIFRRIYSSYTQEERLEIRRERHRVYRQNNKDKRARYQRERRKQIKADPERYRDSVLRERVYYERKKVRQLARRKQYLQTAQGRVRSSVTRQRYRARKLSLPYIWTEQDWAYCLDYFNHCCAVCGRQLRDLFGTHTAAADHWIPLSHKDCPGTVVTNMIPLCHGEGGCNNHKTSKLPEQWLSVYYKPAQVKAIMKRINDYFASVSQPGERETA